MADASGTSHTSPRDLFVGFGTAPLPDAIEAFRFRVNGEADPSGLERYALRLFNELDIDRLRDIAERAEITLARITRMDAFYLNFDHAQVSANDQLILYQVEAVLNRLLRVIDRAGGSDPSEEACSILDQRNFQRVTASVHDMLDEAGAANPWARPGSIRCEPGGEWDLRTRLASRCESFSPITRLEYGFDCNAAAGEVALWFIAPDASAMPRTICEEESASWRELSEDERADLAREHAARIALVLAAAAFSAGMRVARCSVTVRPPREPGSSITYAFERPAFFAVCVPLATRLVDQPLPEAPAWAALEPAVGEPVATAVSAEGAVSDVAEGVASADGASDGVSGEVSVEAPDAVSDAAPDAAAPAPAFRSNASPADIRRRPIAEDSRPLPPALRDLLMADTVRELNIMEPKDSPSMARFNALRPVIATEPDRAARELADLAGELEGVCAAQELAAPVPTTSQFCENGLCRALLPLLADDRSTRIARAPDALFFAQYELSNLYMRQGRYDLALQEARRTLDIAGTSIQAHFALINILARLQQFNDLVEVCRHGLRVAYERRSAAYYFYRLAFAYWNLNERTLALACYALVPAGEQVSNVARMEMHTLMAEMGVAEEPSVQEAAATAREAGIPLAPSDEVSDQLANAAVQLVDGGFFTLARACVGYLWQVLGSDELGAVVRSLE